MSKINAFLLVTATVLLTSNCYNSAYIDRGDIDIEVKVPYDGENNIELKMLQDIEKPSSLLYILTSSCVPKGGSCYYNYASCCANLGCFCNRWAFNCHCKPYYVSSATRNDDVTVETTINPKP